MTPLLPRSAETWQLEQENMDALLGFRTWEVPYCVSGVATRSETKSEKDFGGREQREDDRGAHDDVTKQFRTNQLDRKT